MSVITMLDLAKRRCAAKEVGLIEANIAAAPEVKLIPARTIEGTGFDTLLRTGFPTVEFTGLNEGVAPSKSVYETKHVQCFPVRSLIQIDKAAVSVDSPLASLQTDEASGVTEATLRKLGRQFYYGRTVGKGDVKGYYGLVDFVDNTMIVNATGTTANGATSVYFVKFGVKDVQLIFGKNSVLTLPPFRDETATDGNGKKFDASVAHLTGWAGLQCTNPNSLVRICNLTAENGKGLTDSLLASGLALFPAGVTPDAIFMTRRSRKQLQDDRAAKVALQGNGKTGTLGGGSAYAPTPTEFEGIPIVVTDSLLNTEAIVP